MRSVPTRILSLMWTVLIHGCGPAVTCTVRDADWAPAAHDHVIPGIDSALTRFAVLNDENAFIIWSDAEVGTVKAGRTSIRKGVLYEGQLVSNEKRELS